MAIRDWFGEVADWWIFAVLASGVIIEFWAVLYNPAPNWIDAISPNAAVMFTHVPFIVYALCVLMTHFGINYDAEIVAEPKNYYILVAMSTLWLAYSIFFGPRGDTYNLVQNAAAILTGLNGGWLLWPQRPMSQRRPQDQ